MGVASNGKRFVLMRVVHFHGAGGRAGNVGNKLAGGIQRWRSSKSDIPLSPPSSLLSFATRFFPVRSFFSPSLVSLVVSDLS